MTLIPWKSAGWSLARYFNTVLFAIFTFSILIAAIWETTTFISEAKKIKAGAERTVSDLLLATIREPIAQGAAVEAVSQATQLTSKNSNVCLELKLGIQKLLDCESWQSTRRAVSKQSRSIYFDDDNANLAGSFTIYFDDEEIITTGRRRVYMVVLVGLILGLLVWLATSTLIGRIYSEVGRLVDWRGARAAGPTFLIKEFTQIANELNSSIAAEIDAEQAKAVHRINRQIAHDIRSPLGALKILESVTKDLADDHRQLLRLAIQRICDMADDLLNEANPGVDKIVRTVIAPLVQEIVAEKEYEYNARANIRIILEASGWENAEAKVDPAEFKRIISNLINNSVEAIDDSGAVRIDGKMTNGRLFVSVSDTGRGIDPKTLVKIGRESASHGKIDGHGLGLMHAKAAIDRWEGKLDIRSSLGEGTTVTLSIPISNLQLINHG